MKACGTCKIEKDNEEFYKRAASGDGLHTWCKDCFREYRRVNAQHISERSRNYDRVTAEHRRKYASANVERIREYRRVNAERISFYQRQYYLANVERKREYAHANGERKREYARGYRKTLAGKVGERASRARRRALLRGLPHVAWTLEEIIGRDIGTYGFVSCWMCGVELCEEDSPHLDHLVPIAADPAQLSALGVDNPGDVSENLELACSSCNSRKSNKVMLCAVARYLINCNVVVKFAA